MLNTSCLICTLFGWKEEIAILPFYRQPDEHLVHIILMCCCRDNQRCPLAYICSSKAFNMVVAIRLYTVFLGRPAKTVLIAVTWNVKSPVRNQDKLKSPGCQADGIADKDAASRPVLLSRRVRTMTAPIIRSIIAKIAVNGSRHVKCSACSGANM